MNAAQARFVTTNKTRIHNKVTIYKLKDLLDSAIKSAVDKGINQTTITAPSDAEPELLNATKAALKKLGYKVSLEYRVGFMQEGLYREPSTTITVGW